MLKVTEQIQSRDLSQESRTWLLTITQPGRLHGGIWKALSEMRTAEIWRTFRHLLLSYAERRQAPLPRHSIWNSL